LFNKANEKEKEDLYKILNMKKNQNYCCDLI
jgi:hypothetical protein